MHDEVHERRAMPGVPALPDPVRNRRTLALTLKSPDPRTFHVHAPMAALALS